MLNPVAPLPLKDPSLFRQTNHIDGKWVEADSGRTTPVRNPATGEVIGEVPALGAAETRRAIEAAHRAYPAWRAMLAHERAAILHKLNDLMLANAEDLAIIMTAEQGKPLTESRGEIVYAASFIAWFAEEGRRIYGDTIPQNAKGRRIIVQKEPVGVFAAITPWNFPAAMITRKAGPGWAAGCTGVIRPASQTPFSALAIAVLAERAGMPAGVCNIITGPSGETGAELTSNPLVRKLSFTGSTEVGAKLLAQCAPTIKKTSMELGGNAPFIVFDDADLDAAITGAMACKYRNTGQTCVCANRILVQGGIYDAFSAKLREAVEKMKVGNGMDTGVMQGPLINADAVKKVEEHIADALHRGARVVTGGHRHALGGNFFEPTILADVPRGAEIFRDETFGPVAPLFRFTTEAEAIEMANDTPFGLAAYFYTRDLGRAFRVGEALEYGLIGINEGVISTAIAPFGGMKTSGLGREGSKYGIEEYLEVKYLAIGGIGNVSERRFDFDLFVIGGGSGGVRCARIAAGHGARVGIAEARFWGGTCVNVGCVPKKLMVLAAGYGPAAEDARGFGWRAERGVHDWASFIATKDAEIARLNGIYVRLLSGAGVELFETHARFEGPHTLDVGGRRVTAERIVIATGGHPHRPDLPGAEHAVVSDDIFHLPAMPRRIAIMGSGYIAVEFAGIFAGLGAEVDLIFRQPRPLRGFDDDLREGLAEAMAVQGIRLHAARTLRRIERHGETSVVHLDDRGAITTDLAFLCLGRTPNLRGLGLDRAGVHGNERGAVAVDAEWRTSAPHIYAIGDVTDRINLTPVAIAEGHTLADLLFGMPPGRSWSFAAVPSAVFSSPPIGTVGLTEAQAAARGPADIYLTRFTPMRHTMSGRPLKTVMKLVVDQETDRVLGAHMLGEDAPEIVQGLAVAITAGATKSAFDRTIGIHPTAAEEFVTLRTRTRTVGVAAAAE